MRSLVKQIGPRPFANYELLVSRVFFGQAHRQLTQLHVGVGIDM